MAWIFLSTDCLEQILYTKCKDTSLLCYSLPHKHKQGSIYLLSVVENFQVLDRRSQLHLSD